MISPIVADEPGTLARDEYALRLATNQRDWDGLVDQSPEGYFSQLWDWGEIQRSIGWEPWRLELHSSAMPKPLAAAQLLVRRVPGTAWGVAHSPRGPFLGRSAAHWSVFEEALKDWARQNHIASLIFDPNVGFESQLGSAMMRPPWRAAPMLGEPKCHLVDLLPEADLWRNVHRKHKEWIRRAERSGVQVSWTDGGSSASEAAEALEGFLRVYAEIAERIGVPLRERHYYQVMWDTFRAARRAHLVTATVSGNIAGAMLHFTWGDEMIWFAGGQSGDGAHIGVGKLLVWRSMMRARELGSQRYNMWGTATEGLAQFKLGFGAREESYIGTRSLAVNRVVDTALRAAWQARQIVRNLRQR